MWSFFSRDPCKDFNYEIGDLVPGFESHSVWTLHKGKKKGSGEEVSVFVYDLKSGSDAQLEVAKGAVKRLKTLRHPSVLTFLDSLESEKLLYLVTERVEPLCTHLEKLPLEEPQKDLYVAWGIFQITRGLSFLNNDGSLRHNNVNIWSVFVNNSGEWKLGGVEYVSSAQETTSVIHKVTTSLELPRQLQTLFTELVGLSPQSRPNPADIITRCRKLGGYFKNDLVDTLLFLEEIQIKDKNEKNRFFSNLTPHLDNFADNICKHKILPQLITAFEYGDAGSAVLAPMFKVLGKLLDETEYQKKIVPCVVKLFGSNDRATRSRLLQQLEHFIGHLQPGTVNEQIFPQIAHGFLDTNPTIREQTVKSVIHLAAKLNYNNLNLEVMRHFARLQSSDDQGGIRTNTTICLGKIAHHLHPAMRQKVLISAFIRAMKDPFPPARIAGEGFGNGSHATILSTNRSVSKSAARFMHVGSGPGEVSQRLGVPHHQGLLGKAGKSLRRPQPEGEHGYGSGWVNSRAFSTDPFAEADVNTATPSLGNAAATWAGWAVTAVTAKFYRSQSDTVKSMNTFANKILNKPGSLGSTKPQRFARFHLIFSLTEQPSSSSISTTTSSVTSMTSLEHEEGSRGNESHGGDADLTSPSDAWSPSDTTPIIPPKDNGKSRKQPHGWDDTEFEPIDENSSISNQKVEEARRKREEKRVLRQKELEARRVGRPAAGPMKLGAKKM
ncbi:hypothetical protein D910_06002 [Dendroctonus ponderosae]|uniref:N-terminal kinase-like protein n=1 Tax=Dendroctonus ponderosae TaxID=77166 RepID=U4U6A8_DENPD|nr:hypothetical protein D910_06002 [Dendroctonus ponderosae]